MVERGLRAAPTKAPRARRAPGPPRAFPVGASLPYESEPPEIGGATPRANPSVALVPISRTLPAQRPPSRRDPPRPGPGSTERAARLRNTLGLQQD